MERLLLLKDAILRDPLFAAEGLDLENGRRAIKELKRTAGEIERVWSRKFIPRIFFLRYPASEAIQPTSFLEKFIESEDARRNFIITPSHESLEKLLESWRNTAEAYLTHVRRYQDALRMVQKLERLEWQTSIGYFDIAPKFSEFFEWTSRLIENGEILTTEAERLFSLFQKNDFTGFCKRLRRSETSNEIHGTLSTPADLLEKKKFYFELKELKDIASATLKAKERYGPVLYETGQFNEGVARTHAFFANILPARQNISVPQFEVFLGDDFFFLDFKRAYFLDHIIYRPLIEKNLGYWCQPATSFYTTFDLGYYADIATLVDFARRPQLDKRAINSQRSSLLDLLLGRAAHYNLRFAELLAIFSYHRKVPKLSFFLIARSYPTLLLLTFNQSVWRIKSPPHLLATRFSRHSPYKNYEALRNDLPFETAREIVEISSKRREYFKKELAYYGL